MTIKHLFKEIKFDCNVEITDGEINYFYGEPKDFPYGELRNTVEAEYIENVDIYTISTIKIKNDLVLKIEIY